MKILKEESVGLIIDMQEKLLPVMQGPENLINKCRILIQGLNELGVSVMMTQQYTKGLGETVNEIKKVVVNNSYYEKRCFSCCDEQNILKKLKQKNVKNIIICGIESHICVMQTAIDLKELGFNPVIVMDCVSSRSKEDLDIVKERFRYENIIMTSAESVLFELTRSAATPEFKVISKLVK